MTFGSLEGLVDADNEVRLIDVFADQLDLRRLGFVVKELKKEGSPAYDSRGFFSRSTDLKPLSKGLGLTHSYTYQFWPLCYLHVPWD